MTMFLNKNDIAELTGRKLVTAQIKQLNHMGITYKLRADGQIIVLTSHVERLLDGKVSPSSKARVEPNWDALNASH